MKKIIAKFPVIILVFAVVVMALVACSRPAQAVLKVDGYPVVFATTDEINSKKFKFEDNMTYIEVCTGVIANKKGDGHVVGHKDLYVSYRYKNHPKKGKKVVSLFPLDNNPDHEALCRYDYIKKKGEWKLIHTS